MIEKSKETLTRERAELVTRLAGQLPIEDRVRIQGELSVINARIKALNTTQAAHLKAAADRRKAAGLAEAQACAARARARIDSASPSPGESDEDPDQPDALDAWIDAVLLRHDVDFTRSHTTGKITISAPPWWASVLEILIAGIEAVARGQELPELPREAVARGQELPELPREAVARGQKLPELPKKAANSKKGARSRGHGKIKSGY